MTARVGLVGYGSSGQGIHAPLLHRAGLAVTVVVTGDPVRAAAASAECGAAVVPDLTTLLARDDVDLVVIASPSGVHAAQASACIAAGTPVVVDKPLAVDAQSAYAVVEAARRAAVPLTVFQNRRYDPEFATIRHVVSEGLVGEPVRAELRWERWRPVPKHRWREQADWRDGGGIMLDLHTHLVDQAVLLFGPVRSVYAEVRSWTTVAEDDAFLALHHESGMTTHVGATSVSAAAGPRLRLLGREGAYLLATSGTEETVLTDFPNSPGTHGWLLWGQGRREAVPARHADPADFYQEVAAALDSPDPQGQMPVDPRDAVHVLAVLDAARRSAAHGAVIEVVTPGRP
jgi:predicted dehydrogenase